MYQLRNLINRRNVVKDTKKNVVACEDFMLLLTEAHILAAAMTLFGMESLEDTPSHEMFTVSEETDSLQRRDILLKAAGQIVTSFVDVSFGKGEKRTPSSAPSDGVKAYACEILNLGLLLMEFIDAIRQEDGHRICRCWRYMMLIFKANGRTNYSIEAVHLLLQLQFTLSPRMAAQLKWNRTVNIHGRPGKNVSSDLHMEHLNRECKNAISSMGANITGKSIQKVGRAIKVLSETVHNLDEMLGVPQESGYHTTRSSKKDLAKVLQQIQDTHIFSDIPQRSHVNFPNFCPNSMNSLSRKELEQWLTSTVSKILTYH